MKKLFEEIKPDENKKAEVLRKLLEYNEWKEGGAAEMSKGYEGRELKPEKRGSMWKRYVSAGVSIAAVAALAAVIILYTASTGSMNSGGNHVSAGSGASSQDELYSDGIQGTLSELTEQVTTAFKDDYGGNEGGREGETYSVPDTEYTAYRYVYKIVCNKETDTYLLYTGTVKQPLWSSADYVDTIISVDVGNLYKQEGPIEDGNFWAKIEFDGMILESYPMQIYADKVTLISPEGEEKQTVQIQPAGD